jgi:hypothetical protein
LHGSFLISFFCQSEAENDKADVFSRSESQIWGKPAEIGMEIDDYNVYQEHKE